MLKQVLKVTVVLALLVAVASPAWANNVNVILDDPTYGGGNLGYFLPPGTTGPYNLAWQSCGYPPTDPTEPAATYTACLAVVNNTGNTITDFSVTIDITDPTSPLLGDTFSCATGALNITNCSSLSFQLDVPTVLEFTGTPGVLNGGEFYIGISGSDVTNSCDSTTGVCTSDLPDPIAKIPTHDPSTLVLLLAGMTLLAMRGVRRLA